MIPTIIGLDHAVIAVRDLAAAAAEWAALGFRLSPRGTHSPHMGSGNHTIMFGEDYIELLGVLTEQPHNQGLRDFLAGREGLERCAFTTTDAAAAVAALQARGIAASGPVEFGRPVTMPDGSEAEAQFSVMLWPQDAAPVLRLWRRAPAVALLAQPLWGALALQPPAPPGSRAGPGCAAVPPPPPTARRNPRRT